VTETEQMWSERVAAWKASGQTPEAFTRGEPYAPSTLRWWSSRLRRRVRADTTSAPAKHERKRRTPFVRMAEIVRKSESAVPVVVEVGRARIIVGERFDAGLLARVVAALGGEK
jgi:hypothetical protein